MDVLSLVIGIIQATLAIFSILQNHYYFMNSIFCAGTFTLICCLTIPIIS